MKLLNVFAVLVTLSLSSSVRAEGLFGLLAGFSDGPVQIELSEPVYTSFDSNISSFENATVFNDYHVSHVGHGSCCGAKPCCRRSLWRGFCHRARSCCRSIRRCCKPRCHKPCCRPVRRRCCKPRCRPQRCCGSLLGLLRLPHIHHGHFAHAHGCGCSTCGGSSTVWTKVPEGGISPDMPQAEPTPAEAKAASRSLLPTSDELFSDIFVR